MPVTPVAFAPTVSIKAAIPPLLQVAVTYGSDANGYAQSPTDNNEVSYKLPHAVVILMPVKLLYFKHIRLPSENL